MILARPPARPTPVRLTNSQHPASEEQRVQKSTLVHAEHNAMLHNTVKFTRPNIGQLLRDATRSLQETHAADTGVSAYEYRHTNEICRANFCVRLKDT